MELFSALERELEERVPSLELRENEPMSAHTTFRIGGPIRLMALPKTAEEAVLAVRTAYTMGISPIFLGNGSNLLVADSGVSGFAVKATGLKKLTRQEETVIAESGVLLSVLASFAREHGLTGLEFAGGIPGSFGGAVTMNAGAYDGEMSKLITQTVCLTPEGELQYVIGSEHDFSYRHSAFSDGSRMILQSALVLRQGNPKEIEETMADLARRRRSSQPLDLPSAGSVFKRPKGNFAGTLIDSCGLKGTTVGGAQVSVKHAGFIVNLGGATCEDVLGLVAYIQKTVLEKTGVSLEMEIKTLGI
ncbi:UDP-N-acetylenolpyruvoylglucosamine reductase [bioreactor metagenome]|uniref:UDP-N-acetylmuramate dehydrogenase n=1 Tax=bioreactor metagenome TaxID=1076179 RepID=A0A645A7I9_9ZZZZ